MSKSRGISMLCRVACLEKTRYVVQVKLDVCELLCNSECYLVTFCPISRLCENPTRVGRDFLPRLGSRFST